MRSINKNKKCLILKQIKKKKNVSHNIWGYIYKDTKYDRFKTVLLIYKMYINIMHINNKIDIAKWAVIAY